MTARIDMTGLRFGRLLVLDYSHTDNGVAFWICRCGCGAQVTCHGPHLRSALTTSCGCLRGELSAARGKTQLITHGQSRTRTYRSWRAMHKRCLNRNSTGYEYWGGRGIGLDDPRWNEYPPFLADMGERPEGYHLHRIDNDRGYCKDNCVWLAPSEHARLHANQRRMAT